VGGVVAALLGGGLGRLLASFNITIGGVDPYGYNRNTDLAIVVGNISGTVFNDASGNSRTLTCAIDGTGDLIFALDGISIPDTAATFTLIKVGSALYYRSDRTTYIADTGALDDTAWKWANGAVNSIGTSGSVQIEIYG
jgi:hypothetical protein